MKGQMLSNMLMFATYKHCGQIDKGGEPYILHPLAVMHLLYTDDEELQCIALGHDLVEDCEVTWQQLRNIGMTQRVLNGIDSLTKIPGERYAMYKLRVKANSDAVRVKLCDLQHNMDPSRKYVIPRSLHKRYAEFSRELQALR
jgi:GTP diphosphokinase / guanosine-3',5'-bis(diphosphate) 3'-diphosphatase